MTDMRLSGIHIYPLKSCAGVDLPSVTLDRFGPAGDRRWMVVDAEGRFLSQRGLPVMALVSATPLPEGGLLLSRGDSRCPVAVPGPGAPPLAVTIWDDSVTAVDAGDGAAVWLTRALGRECRLVHMPGECRRPVDPAYARHGETVGFADGFPLLLISEASLAALNERLEQPVPMNRFRPNLVVSGCEPFAEDRWRRIRVGDVTLEVAKPCSRCAIPSIDQATGERDRFINRALASFRRFDGQILFGQNLLYRETGELRVGDEVEVLE